MQIKLSHTRINFFCWKNVNIEDYIHDTMTVGAVSNMIDDLNPAMDVYVEIVPNNPGYTASQKRAVVREYLEQELGAAAIRNKVRVFKNAGQYRISCADQKTFLDILKLAKEPT